ncbi:MAG: DUF493 family protein [Deltaproteobacteria bacterium]|nr:DUF493 family protein [Deltaproteobacteria bacterium]
MDTKNFKSLLDNHYSWPAEYPFKFIVPAEKVHELKALLELDKLDINPSKKGNYMSIRFKRTMKCAQDVIDIYEKVKGIEGIMSL